MRTVQNPRARGSSNNRWAADLFLHPGCRRLGTSFARASYQAGTPAGSQTKHRRRPASDANNRSGNWAGAPRLHGILRDRRGNRSLDLDQRAMRDEPRDRCLLGCFRGSLSHPLSSGQFRLQPVGTDSEIHDQRHGKLRGMLHLISHEFLHGTQFPVRHLEHQLVVYLEQHLAL